VQHVYENEYIRSAIFKMFSGCKNDVVQVILYVYMMQSCGQRIILVPLVNLLHYNRCIKTSFVLGDVRVYVIKILINLGLQSFNTVSITARLFFACLAEQLAY